MNLRYRLKQIWNSAFPPNGKSAKWIYVYGLPRSGTTYFYHQLMQHAKLGVSDYDLGKFIPAMKHYQGSDYIPIDSSDIIDFLRNQIRLKGAPGGGSSFDFIVKQVYTTKEEFDLICSIMGSKPEHSFFLFREPEGWYASAIKKFNLDQEGALKMYQNSIQSFQEIGGEVIEYGPGLETALNQLGYESHEPFVMVDKKTNEVKGLEGFQSSYEEFKASL